MKRIIYWRVFFDHTFDLLNQILLGFIRFYNFSRILYPRYFLLVRNHQKAIQLSIRSQRRERCGIILTKLERWFTNDLEMFSFTGDISFFEDECQLKKWSNGTLLSKMIVAFIVYRVKWDQSSCSFLPSFETSMSCLFLFSSHWISSQISLKYIGGWAIFIRVFLS